MAATDLLHDTKTQDLSSKRNTNKGENLLEKLPIEVILHILSLLSTKDAVKTCRLSKKWVYTWMLVDRLHFYETVTNRSWFLKFVDRVMMLNQCSNLVLFDLACSVKEDASRVNTWISAAIGRNVKEVFLRLNGTDWAYALPSRLFDSQSLKVLEFGMYRELKLPSTISLPNLEELSMELVRFVDDQSMKRLFSSCPNIQKLTLNECDWKDVKAVTISLPKLEYLDIFEPIKHENHSNVCQIVVIGPSLKTLVFRGEVRNDYCLYSSSVVDVLIEVGYSKQELIQRDNAYHLHRLLWGLSDMKRLTISLRTLEVLSSVEELFSHLPVFHRLADLILTPKPENSTSRLLVQKIIQNSPLLDSDGFGNDK